MVTAIKGDRTAKTSAAYEALDFAFNCQIADNFKLMYLMRGDPDRAAQVFVQKFIVATDMWNLAKATLDAEYPVLDATQVDGR